MMKKELETQIKYLKIELQSLESAFEKKDYEGAFSLMSILIKDSKKLVKYIDEVILVDAPDVCASGKVVNE